eukprot:jgi/Mesvir1/16312/Mv12764-RA.1
MRAVVAWSDKVPDRDGVKSVCYDIAFKPDGTQLVAAVGSRVLVYDAVDGDLLHSLKGHRDTVYCVAYSRDGKRFASGGADKTIIIWTSKAEGILKYNHNDSVQCLTYNPITQQLLSATASDFGLWSPEQKSVAKHKVQHKVLCAAWTNDGQYIALGQINGHISVRDKSGSEKVLIERNSPVWTLQWNPSREESYDVLAVGCWDGTLSFYQLSGIQVGKDKVLGYDPCSVAYFSNGEYICVGGTDRKVSLATKEGTTLTTMAERDDWVWCIRPRPKQNYIAVGCNDGTISMYQLIFSTVHGLYQDRYAYRDYMTDVIIQHLITEKKVRIRCKDYVKKIAVFKDRLAVQLIDRVMIYKLSAEDQYDMRYRVTTKINKKLDCNLLVVTSLHVILCQEKKLQLYNFAGDKEREWVLESVIRYIKVVGGPSGKEGLLVGLKSGIILKIYINNPFPINLIKHSTSIRCLDLSMKRKKLAVVDENTSVLVYNLATKELLIEEKNANSVAWNTEMEDMFCFSGNGMLSIKTGDFPIHQQKLQGFVVGFKGSKVFCLHYVSMQTIDVPQSASLYRYVEKGDFENAYKVACVGVTENDWRLLAMEALQAMSLDIARKSFIRVRDMRYIDLLNRIEHGRRTGANELLFVAEVQANQGKYQDAARTYAKCGAEEKAMEMFSDLRQFEEAKAWAEEFAKNKGDDTNVQTLIQQQAEWSEEVADYEAAADMYLKARQYEKAIALIGKHEWKEKLLEVARMLPLSEAKALGMCAHFFRAQGQLDHAKEVYLKMGDVKSLVTMLVEAHRWNDAFFLLKTNPDLGEAVYMPYARWLCGQDKFDEARVAYKDAGRPELATRMLEQLTHNAVVENRFKDAGRYFWHLAMEALAVVTCEQGRETESDRAQLARFRDHYERAEVYYAYHSIYRCIDEPFRTVTPETLFSTGLFLLNRMEQKQLQPLGVSKVNVVFTVAKQGQSLGALKLARNAYEKLQGLKVPFAWMDQIDVACLRIRARPFTDAEELVPVCYRCSTANPLLSSHGDACLTCGQPFQRSFITFDVLPLVEFELEDDISDAEAVKLIEMEPRVTASKRSRDSRSSSDRNDWGGDRQVLSLGNDDNAGDDLPDMDDPFTRQMLLPNQPIKVDREMLTAMHRSEVFVRRWPCPAVPNAYFRVMDPDASITLCPHCNHFFETEEFEMAQLEKDECPLCGVSGPPPTIKDNEQPRYVPPPPMPSRGGRGGMSSSGGYSDSSGGGFREDSPPPAGSPIARPMSRGSGGAFGSVPAQRPPSSAGRPGGGLRPPSSSMAPPSGGGMVRPPSASKSGSSARSSPGIPGSRPR